MTHDETSSTWLVTPKDVKLARTSSQRAGFEELLTHRTPSAQRRVLDAAYNICRFLDLRDGPVFQRYTLCAFKDHSLHGRHDIGSGLL